MSFPKLSEEFLEFAKGLVLKSGGILEQYRQSYIIKKFKDTQNLDVATSADYAAEKVIVTAIRTKYVTHGILAEESGISLPNADYVWIIDPLDGTKEYIRNSPYYYSLISLEHKGLPVCAVGYQPSIKRIFFGSVLSGAFANNIRMHVSMESILAKSFLSISLPNSAMPRKNSEIYFKAIRECMYAAYRLRNTQWDVEALFNVASGTVEGYVLPPLQSGGPKWWDISSGLQIVEIAGGRITDFHGNRLMTHDTSNGIIASNGLIHDQLLSLLKKYYP